ncbi:hypothetical protein ACLK19_23295 [Escherichia coli]
MLKAVNLDDSVLDKRPPQLSGGQLPARVCSRSRAGGEPKLPILDEAVSNLKYRVTGGHHSPAEKATTTVWHRLPVHRHDLHVETLLSAGDGDGQRTNDRKPGGGSSINLFL